MTLLNEHNLKPINHLFRDWLEFDSFCEAHTPEGDNQLEARECIYACAQMATTKEALAKIWAGWGRGNMPKKEHNTLLQVRINSALKTECLNMAAVRGYKLSQLVRKLLTDELLEHRSGSGRL